MTHQDNREFANNADYRFWRLLYDTLVAVARAPGRVGRRAHAILLTERIIMDPVLVGKQICCIFLKILYNI